MTLLYCKQTEKYTQLNGDLINNQNCLNVSAASALGKTSTVFICKEENLSATENLFLNNFMVEILSVSFEIRVERWSRLFNLICQDYQKRIEVRIKFYLCVLFIYSI